jgi:hypothetical protein
LLGFSASGSSGETEPNQLMVTYHHNWFDRTASRHPRARWAPVHVYNNLYTGNNIYGVGSACGAKVYVERNYFDNVARPVLISGYNDPEGTLSGDPLGYAKSVENYSNAEIVADNSDAAFSFDPKNYYSYSADSAVAIPEVTKALAGAGKLNFIAADPSTVGVRQNQGSQQPTDASLYQNYPNPFNPATIIRYSLADRDRVNLEVYDILGRRVVELVNEVQAAGDHSIVFDASQLPTGIYFYSLQSRFHHESRKMVLVK